MMQIWQATKADQEAVCDLWKILLQFYGKQRDPELLKRSFDYAVMHPERVRIYVAAVDGVIAGTASLHLGHYSTWNDYWYGHVEDVVVAPAYRGRGIGKSLLRHVLEEGKAAGLGRLELNVLVDNDTARRMYEGLGFKTDSVVYEFQFFQE